MSESTDPNAEETLPDEREQGIDAAEELASEDLPRRSMWYRLQSFAYRKFPRIIPDPDREEILRAYRISDDQKNAETEPSLDEVIDTRCIWAVELYTPSQISELLRRFKKLGWNKDAPSLPDHNPFQWIQSHRQAARGGGWFNLGPLFRHGDSRFRPYGLEAPLPKGVDYAIATMHALTSSVTCIVVGFLLDESHGRQMEEALRRQRQTEIEPRPEGGHIIPGPSHLKQREVQRIRRDLRALASDWFRTYLPGCFAGDALAGEYPTCEFTTLKEAIPCPGSDKQDSSLSKWLWLLNIDDEYNAWQADDLPGLIFVWPLLSDPKNLYHAIVTCREDIVPDKKRHLFGGGRTSLTLYIEEYVQGLLSRWSLLGLLAGYERHINTTRDSAAFISYEPATALQQLEMLRGHVAQSVDVSAAAADLKRLCERKAVFLHSVEKFTACDLRFHRDNTSLGEALRVQIEERSDWLREVDRTVRDLLMEHGMALSAHENVKAQDSMVSLTKVIKWLTIVIAVLTAVTTIVSIRSGSLPWPW